MGNCTSSGGGGSSSAVTKIATSGHPQLQGSPEDIAKGAEAREKYIKRFNIYADYANGYYDDKPEQEAAVSRHYRTDPMTKKMVIKEYDDGKKQLYDRVWIGREDVYAWDDILERHPKWTKGEKREKAKKFFDKAHKKRINELKKTVEKNIKEQKSAKWWIDFQKNEYRERWKVRELEYID